MNGSADSADYCRASGGYWSTLSEWRDNHTGTYAVSTELPGSTDTVIINNAVAVTLDCNAVVGKLNLVNTSLPGTLNVTGSNTLQVLNRFSIGYASSGQGSVNQSNGVVSAGSVLVGNRGPGVYTLSGGGLFCESLQVGLEGDGDVYISGGDHSVKSLRLSHLDGENSSGDGMLRLSDGHLTVSNSVLLGRTGNGRIEFEGGGYLEIQNGVAFNGTGEDATVFRFSGAEPATGLMVVRRGNGAVNWATHPMVLDFDGASNFCSQVFLEVEGSANEPVFLIEGEDPRYEATITRTEISTGTYQYTVDYQRRIPRYPEFRSANELSLLLDVFPVSPRALTGGIQTFTVETNFSASGSSWWIPYSEQWAFQVRLQNEQYYNDGTYDPKRSWDLRISPGGSVYSMKGSFGEAVPPQYRGVDMSAYASNRVAEFGPYYAPWVDEVLQGVFVDTSLNTPTNQYFHHQAGVYLMDPEAGGVPFFSPYLGGLSDVSNRTYRTVSWPQQAQIPTEFTSDLICYTEYRDVGQGILEVNEVVYNFGSCTQTYMNLPWQGVRHTSFGHYYIGATDGQLSAVSPQFGYTNYNDTAGWALFCNGTDNASDTFAIVFGHDHVPLDSWQIRESRWQHGGIPSEPENTLETEWNNRVLGYSVRSIKIKPGETFFGRYYLVFGQRSTVVNNLIGPYNLVSSCDYDVYSIAANEAQVMTWYDGGDGLPTTAVSGSPVAVTYNKPVTGTKPLFVLQDVYTDEVYLTDNPYELSNKPYDGRTKYRGFLGFSE